MRLIYGLHEVIMVEIHDLILGFWNPRNGNDKESLKYYNIVKLSVY